MLKIINGNPYIQSGYAEIRVSDEDAKHLAEWYNNQNFVYIRNSEKEINSSIAIWYASYGKGYTTDIREAEIYTLEKALKRTARPEDVFYPVNYINSIPTKHIIDIRDIDYSMRIKKDTEVK